MLFISTHLVTTRPEPIYMMLDVESVNMYKIIEMLRWTTDMLVNCH